MEASPELHAELLALYEAMSSGNADAVEAHYSLQGGSVFVGTDDAEYWTDSAEHNVEVRPFFNGSLGQVRWQAGDAVAMREGEVGWTIDRPAVQFTDLQGDETRFELRVTLVWHREESGWRVVHSHASIGQR